ncbi:MAG: hypothetical protein AAF318_04680 [Pseudomonadota bacterium]
MAMAELIRSFVADEGGASLTEYLILLGVLAGGVSATVVAYSTTLSGIYTAWTAWLTATVGI